jgi:hypothetical protein
MASDVSVIKLGVDPVFIQDVNLLRIVERHHTAKYTGMADQFGVGHEACHDLLNRVGKALSTEPIYLKVPDEVTWGGRS